jgi:MFS family permease
MIFEKSPVLKIRDFQVLFLTRILVSMSLQAQAVIVGWQIYKIRPEPLLLGLMGLVEAVPAIGCSFISGHMVDIHKPARIYQLGILAMVFNTCLIWYAASTSLLHADLRLILLYVGIFISGAARSFTAPAVFSLIPQVIPRSLIPSASAWNSSAYQFAAIVGPSLGGLVYGFAGAKVAFSLPPLFMVLALLGTEVLSKTAKGLKSAVEREPFLKSIRAGIRFAFQNKALFSTMTLDMFSVLFGGAIAMLPIFADQVLHVGSSGLGILRAAPSVGSAFVLLYLGVKPLKFISGKMLLLVVGGFGLATIFFAVSTALPLALFFLAVGGAFDGISMVIRGTILQLLTPDHMRGRVSALSAVFITSSNEIGAFESGVAAKLLGLVPSVVFGGFMTLVVVAVTAWTTPQLTETNIDTEAEV